MKTIKKSSLSVILMVVAVCALFTATLFGVNAKNAFAEDTTAAQYTLEVSDGISLKLNEQGGMRFVVKTDKTTYGYLKNNDGVTLSVLIGPASQFTDEATYATLKDSLINITVDKNKIYQIGGDENYYANACVVEMKDENREIDYTAVAYLLNGETVEAQSAVNAKSTGDFYAVTNQSVIETASTADIFANAAYSWFGTENYAIKLDTLDEYNAFIAKINDVDLTQKYVTLGDYEVADKSKLAAFKHVTAQNKITSLTVADVAYGTAPVPTATAYFGAGTVTYTYATAPDGEYSAWNAANGIGTYYVKATVAAGEDVNVSYAAAEKVAEFTVTKATNAISGFTKDESVTLHCGDALPTYTATATFGTVGYSYSLNGTDYSDSVTLVAGTLYVKATVDGTADYDGAEETLTYAVTHNMVETTVDGITTKTCACGKKEVSGNIANSQISLNVAVSDGVATATAGVLDLTKAFADNAIATVTVGETEVTDVQIASGKISLAGADFAGVYGTQSVNAKFTVDNASYDLTVTAFIVTKQVGTVAELQSIKAISDALGYDGYYVLTADITFGANEYWYEAGLKDGSTSDYETKVTYALGGETWQNPFKGTFDGAGHKIDNLAFKWNWVGSGAGFIQTLGSGGVLKNVAFTNFSGLNKNTIVKQSYNGTIENVYVQYTAKANNQSYSGTFNEDANGVINLKNVVVDFSAATIADLTGSGLNAAFLGKAKAGSVLENVVIFGIESKFNNNIIVNDGSKSIDGIYVYNSDTHTANKAIPATGWDSEYWTVNANSLPMFNSATSAYVTAATFGEKAENIKKGETPTFIGGKNCVIELGEDAIALDITLVDGVLTVPETVPADSTFTVLARNLFDYNNATELTVTYLGAVVEAEVDGSDITIDLNTATDGTVAGTDVEIDLSSVYSYTAENVTATYKGTALENVSLANGKLTFNTKNLAGAYDKTDIIVTVKDDNGTTQITVKNIFVITKTVKTADELKTVATIVEKLNGGGYYTLGNDIVNVGTFTNYSICPARTGTLFVGTFDGMGYSISGLSIGGWEGRGFITAMGNGGVLKNVAFLNTEIKQQGTIVSYAEKGSATVENVYIKFKQSTYTNDQNKSGVLGINDNAQNLTLKNVVFDYSEYTYTNSKDAAPLVGNYADISKLSNVVVLGVTDAWVGKVAKVGTAFTSDGMYITYNTTEEKEPTGTFSAEGWDETYWSVSGTTVTWKTKA